MHSSKFEHTNREPTRSGPASDGERVVRTRRNSTGAPRGSIYAGTSAECAGTQANVRVFRTTTPVLQEPADRHEAECVQSVAIASRKCTRFRSTNYWRDTASTCSGSDVILGIPDRYNLRITLDASTETSWRQ